MGDYCNPPPNTEVLWGILRHSKGGVVGEYCGTAKVVWWGNIVTQKRWCGGGIL